MTEYQVLVEDLITFSVKYMQKPSISNVLHIIRVNNSTAPQLYLWRGETSKTNKNAENLVYYIKSYQFHELKKKEIVEHT